MAMSKCKMLMVLALLFLPSTFAAADSSQTIKIRTDFTKMSKPASWLIIVKDVDSPAVYPYLFDLTKEANTIVIFTNARNYRVISVVQFPHAHRQISNYCLPQAIISDLSLEVTVKGDLSPNRATSDCSWRAEHRGTSVVKKDDTP